MTQVCTQKLVDDGGNQLAGSLRVPPGKRLQRLKRAFCCGSARRTALGTCLLLFMLAAAAQAQVGFPRTSSHFDLAESVQIDRADGAALARLERVKSCLADRQWDEAVETLRQVMESSEGKLLAVTPWRYVNLSEACQMRLAALPPEALKLYRSRIDPVAKKWYDEGIAHRDAKLLTNVVQQAFASSFGDKALMALGEIRLEEGDFSAARWCWERILPVAAPPGEVKTWPGYPDTTLDPAAVRARLVLVSILEGSTKRARDELSQFARMHGDARGRLGGHKVRYAAALADLLNQSASWPKAAPDRDWLTFAGSPSRNSIAPPLIDAAAVQWRAKFGRQVRPAAGPPAAGLGASRMGAADDLNAPLSYHPVICRGRIYLADANQIFGFRADSGRPAWGGGDASIYRDPADVPAFLPAASELLGTPRYTLTIADGRLYARMGVPIANSSQQPNGSVAGGTLICLDLRAEGKLLWKVDAEEGWAFDGAPIIDGERLFVAMRHSDIRPQAHVACFDAATGRMRWRRFICAAETPARGTMAECTNNLLTFADGSVYVNTNLGAVASLEADSGRINWLSLYPRARSGSLARMDAHWSRDLNPCLFDHGRLYVAPADSPRVYAFDAGTGQILWPGRRKGQPADAPIQDPLDDVLHLLGVSGDCLIASGRRLYWINLDGPRAGDIAHQWPDGPDQLGYGRGVLAGDSVLWPAREKIYVFDQRTARLKKEIDLGPLGARGGNLLVAGGRLLIANSGQLIVLGVNGGKKKVTPPEITSIR